MRFSFHPSSKRVVLPLSVVLRSQTFRGDVERVEDEGSEADREPHRHEQVSRQYTFILAVASKIA